MIVGKVIQAFRESRGISVRKMAKTIGVEHSALWRFEHGKAITTTTWVRIVTWLLTSE